MSPAHSPTTCGHCKNAEATVVVGDRDGGEMPCCAKCWHMILNHSERAPLFKRWVIRGQPTR